MGKNVLTLQHIRALHEAHLARGSKVATRKLKMLEQLASLKLSRPKLMLQYHDILLSLIAFPSNPAIKKLADSELNRVAQHVQGLSVDQREQLLNTGMTGSCVECSLSFDTTWWLSKRFAESVEIAWENGSAGLELNSFLHACVPNAEREGLMNDRVTTEGWFKLAKGSSDTTDLSWLFEQLRRIPSSTEVRDQIFESLNLYIRWNLGVSTASRTNLRFPARRIYYRSDSSKRIGSLSSIVHRKLPTPRRLSARQSADLIEIARRSLAVRSRETNPVTYANPKEVTLFSLEKGIDIALFGMLPARRQPIECFFGYLAAVNRVPVAYGGGWVFFRKAEIGINVFEAFRGMGSSYLFAQIMRVYRQHYGIKEFSVDPYQFGDENDEGIRSGAFWFYYRLGFRHRDKKLASLAEKEWSQISRKVGYRSSLSTLRKLASAPLLLRVQDKEQDPTELYSPTVSDVGLAITERVGRQFQGDHRAALKWANRRVNRALEDRMKNGWTQSQVESFQQLSLLAAFIPDLDSWSKRDRRALHTLLGSKGGVRERDYLMRLQKHTTLNKALNEFV